MGPGAWKAKPAHLEVRWFTEGGRAGALPGVIRSLAQTDPPDQKYGDGTPQTVWHFQGVCVVVSNSTRASPNPLLQSDQVVVGWRSSYVEQTPTDPTI